jgi:sigma-54 dependent transcriptional regulator, acetoin dehydrogenase operon transcriptional activator AcoR
MNIEATLYESMLRCIEDPVFLLAPSGEVLWSNRAACLPSDQGAGPAHDSFWTVFGRSDELRRKLEQCLSELVPVQVECTSKRNVYSITLAPVEARPGQAVIAICRDVTELKRGQDALYRIFKEKEHFRKNLEATFRSIPDTIVSVDLSLRVIMTNGPRPGECVLASEESIGKTLSHIEGCRGSACLKALEQTIQSRRPIRSYQVQCQNAGSARFIELSTAPVFDQRNEFTGAMLLVKDVTRLVELEKTLSGRQLPQAIVGKSDPMRQVMGLIDQLAHLDATVLITGESGTGKELVVDALHNGGSRSRKPLIKVNCAALSENILESELFGHIRGAFTGAVQDRVGRIQAAEGGTLFLDEIGDLPHKLQVKLLRFLEQKEYERVGETRTRQANVRLLAATNADLPFLVREGRFREDLYYRLNVFRINLPPLRRRREDIPLLARHFLDFFARQYKKDVGGIHEETLAFLLRHQWPGNIRELRHVIEHAIVLCTGERIRLEHLPEEILNAARRDAEPAPIPQSAPQDEKTLIMDALLRAQGNRSRAAQLLGVHRATLYRRMAALGLRPE